MRGRLTESARLARLAEAQELARQRATQWRLSERDKDGNLMAGHHIVDATDEEAAIIAVCDRLGIRKNDARAPKAAQPLLGSKDWRRIYEEVGLA